MNKQKTNYVVDLLAFLAFLVTAISGLVLYFFLPEGIRRGGYQQFWGVSKRAWIDVHDVSGLIFILLVVIHFVLHWKWIVSTTKCFFSGDDAKTCPATEQKQPNENM